MLGGAHPLTVGSTLDAVVGGMANACFYGPRVRVDVRSFSGFRFGRRAWSAAFTTVCAFTVCAFTVCAQRYVRRSGQRSGQVQQRVGGGGLALGRERGAQRRQPHRRWRRRLHRRRLGNGDAALGPRLRLLRRRTASRASRRRAARGAAASASGSPPSHTRLELSPSTGRRPFPRSSAGSRSCGSCRATAARSPARRRTASSPRRSRPRSRSRRTPSCGRSWWLVVFRARPSAGGGCSGRRRPLAARRRPSASFGGTGAPPRRATFESVGCCLGFQVFAAGASAGSGSGPSPAQLVVGGQLAAFHVLSGLWSAHESVDAEITRMILGLRLVGKETRTERSLLGPGPGHPGAHDHASCSRGIPATNLVQHTRVSQLTVANGRRRVRHRVKHARGQPHRTVHVVAQREVAAAPRQQPWPSSCAQCDQPQQQKLPSPPAATGRRRLSIRRRPSCTATSRKAGRPLIRICCGGIAQNGGNRNNPIQPSRRRMMRAYYH